MSLLSVYAALCAVMKEVGAVGKNKRNTQGGGYQYRGIDDVMAAVQPIMAEYGLVCVPRVIEREREQITTNKGSGMVSVRLLVEHTFYGPDGSSVICTTLGEAFDSGDKASNKAMAVALKYALTETLMIPTYEADRDTEEQTHEVAAPPPRPQAGQHHQPHPTVQKAKEVFPGAVEHKPDDFELIRADLLQVWPNEEGEDRDQRLGFWWAQLKPSKTAKMPDDWSPAKAFRAAPAAQQKVIKATAARLAGGSGSDDE
jgi:hypothetical protein